MDETCDGCGQTYDKCADSGHAFVAEYEHMSASSPLPPESDV